MWEWLPGVSDGGQDENSGWGIRGEVDGSNGSPVFGEAVDKKVQHFKKKKN